MKRPVFAVILFALLFTSSAFAAEGVKWQTLTEGMAKAKAEKKPVIVDFFFGKGCPRCEFLDKEIYHNPAIAKKIMDDFVPIRIDLTKKLSAEEQSLGEKYDFKNDCLLLFLDREGKLVKEGSKRLCFIDKVDPEEFMRYLDAAKSVVIK